MSREIKFRGIYNNTFVYGNYIKANIDGRIFYQIENSDSSDFYKWEVEENTIGQFTSLKDNNGNEVYEGDIVKSGNGRVWKISFGEYIYYDQMPNLGFYLESKTCNFPMCKNGNIEVIGNIYENPDLL